MNKISYSINSLSDREEIFFRSVIVMYNSPNNNVWSRDDENFDVLIVGKEFDPNSLSLSPKTTVILSMNPTFVECQNKHIINVILPIKATELIKNIGHAELLLSQSPTAINTLLQDKTVKLLRWPSAAILAQDNAYPILAALLSKRAMTITDLVSFSKKTPEVCNKFLSLIVTNKDAEYMETIHISENVLPQKTVKKSLLDRIKASLGLS